MDLSFSSSLPGGSAASLSSMASSATPSSLAALSGAAGQKNINIPAAQKAATDFESFFASQFLGEMFKDVKADDVFGGGDAEDTFRPFLLDQYAKQIAKRGSLGIADSVMKSLLAHQEASG